MRSDKRSKISKEELQNALLLYAVTDRRWTGELNLFQQVELAIAGGATFIQLREKNLSESAFEKEAIAIQNLCRAHGIPFVVNDNVEIAKRMGADGVHVGQSDMEAGDVRALLGPDAILGVSAQTVEQAKLAEARGADYLGVGAVFPTGSKDDAIEVPFETLKSICEAVSIPVVAIGGISEENVSELKGSGICGIAVISAIFGKKNIKKSTEELLIKTKEMVEA
ncbi:MAG: thiamine phosphate synthase [Clostridiales bacterium]|nr:thiamine phosphate synthase [Clostridiales bacterium]